MLEAQEVPARAAGAQVISTHPVGDLEKQWAHHEVGFLIRSTRDFIVHIDKAGRLDWETAPHYDQSSRSRPSALLTVLSDVEGDISVAESNPLQGYSPEVKHHFYKLLGEARVHWIEADAATARKLIRAALIYYRERSEETSRRWYLSAGITSASLFGMAAILGWINRSTVIHFIGHFGFAVFMAACGGAIGAMFSIIARSGKLNFRASSGRGLHNLEASSRITAGAISGVIAYLAVKSGLVFGALVHGPSSTALFLLITLAAGAGERLATSIISKFDDAPSEPPSSPSNITRIDEQ